MQQGYPVNPSGYSANTLSPNLPYQGTINPNYVSNQYPSHYGMAPRNQLVPSMTQNSAMSQPIRQTSGSSTMKGEVWIPSASDRQQLDNWFDSLNPNKGEFIAGTNAVSFLKNSNLSKEMLRKIWELVDSNNVGYINRLQFYTIMRLISISCCPIYAGSVPSLERYFTTAKDNIALPAMIASSPTIRSTETENQQYQQQQQQQLQHLQYQQLQYQQQQQAYAQQAYHKMQQSQGSNPYQYPSPVPQIHLAAQMPQQVPPQQHHVPISLQSYGQHPTPTAPLVQPSYVAPAVQLMQPMMPLPTVTIPATTTQEPQVQVPPQPLTDRLHGFIAKEMDASEDFSEFASASNSSAGVQPPLSTPRALSDLINSNVSTSSVSLLSNDITLQKQSSPVSTSLSAPLLFPPDDDLMGEFSQAPTPAPAPSTGSNVSASSHMDASSLLQFSSPSRLLQSGNRTSTPTQHGAQKQNSGTGKNLESFLLAVASDPLSTHRPTLSQLQQTKADMDFIGVDHAPPPPPKSPDLLTLSPEIGSGTQRDLDGHSITSSIQRGNAHAVNLRMSELDALAENDLQAVKEDWDDFAESSSQGVDDGVKNTNLDGDDWLAALQASRPFVAPQSNLEKINNKGLFFEANFDNQSSLPPPPSSSSYIQPEQQQPLESTVDFSNPFDAFVETPFVPVVFGDSVTESSDTVAVATFLPNLTDENGSKFSDFEFGDFETGVNDAVSLGVRNSDEMTSQNNFEATFDTAHVAITTPWETVFADASTPSEFSIPAMPAPPAPVVRTSFVSSDIPDVPATNTLSTSYEAFENLTVYHKEVNIDMQEHPRKGSDDFGDFDSAVSAFSASNVPDVVVKQQPTDFSAFDVDWDSSAAPIPSHATNPVDSGSHMISRPFDDNDLFAGASAEPEADHMEELLFASNSPPPAVHSSSSYPAIPITPPFCDEDLLPEEDIPERSSEMSTAMIRPNDSDKYNAFDDFDVLADTNVPSVPVMITSSSLPSLPPAPELKPHPMQKSESDPLGLSFSSPVMSGPTIAIGTSFTSIASSPTTSPILSVSGLSKGELDALAYTLCTAQHFAEAHACFRQAAVKLQLMVIASS